MLKVRYSTKFKKDFKLAQKRGLPHAGAKNRYRKARRRLPFGEKTS